MRILVAAVTAAILLACASATAQSLEQTYADLCADPGRAATETCTALSQALAKKHQAQVVAPPAVAPVPAPAVLAATSSTARGTKQDAIPLVLGQKLAGRLDDNSPRSWGNRVTYYRLSGLKGQTFVVALDCDINAFYGCFYTGVVPEKSLAYQVKLADSPLVKAFRFDLKKDNPLLEVWSAGNVDFAIVVQEGAAGDALWTEVQGARVRYDAAVAKKKSERSAERGALFGAVLQGLAQGTAEATHEQQQAQATQDAMLAQVQQQAMQIQQAHAQPLVAGQQGPAQAEASSDSATTGTTNTEPGQAAEAKPLRFVLLISLRNQPGDTVNPVCYSNVVTRPGPPGWGAPGFLPPGSGEQARQMIQSLKSEFIAACRASGREITSEGNFSSISNQFQHDEQRLMETGPRHREDVSVTLN